MKNSPEVEALSYDAQALLAGCFGLSANSTLTLQNRISRLSKRAAPAMVELVAAGIVSDEKADDGYPNSRTYRLTEKGASLKFRKSAVWMEKHGKISITEPIEG